MRGLQVGQDRFARLTAAISAGGRETLKPATRSDCLLRLRDGAWRGVRRMTPFAVLFRMSIDLSAACAIFLSVLTIGDASGADAAAARAAAIHDAIMSFEHGYQTRIGSLGSRLSGGERQRICIARAILKDAPIVILDEATSALDPEQEEAIQRAISALAAGRTLLVIAHDLPSIVSANQVVLLNDGKIEASGTHETVLESSPTYRRLWKRSVEMRQWQIADDHR